MSGGTASPAPEGEGPPPGVSQELVRSGPGSGVKPDLGVSVLGDSYYRSRSAMKKCAASFGVREVRRHTSRFLTAVAEFLGDKESGEALPVCAPKRQQGLQERLSLCL